MKLGNKQILELLGVSSVVVSLLFVGYQLMLDRRVAMADSFASSIEGRKADLRTKLESESYLKMQKSLWESEGPPDWWIAYLKLTDSPTLESVEEIHVRHLVAFLDVLELTSINFRYEQGLIEESYWLGSRRALKGQLMNPFRRAVYLEQAGVLLPLIREVLAEIDSESGT